MGARGTRDAAPELRAALIEIILTPPLGLAAAARAADAASRDADQPTTAARDDRQLLMDAFAAAVARDAFVGDGGRLSDVAQQAGVELDVAQALFADELDCAAQALNAWGGRLVVLAAGAFLTAAGDPPWPRIAARSGVGLHRAHARARGARRHRRAGAIPAVTAMREPDISLFFQLIAVQVPSADQEAPQPLATLEVVLDGVMAVLRRFAHQGRIGELPQRAADAEPAGPDAVLRRRGGPAGR